MFPWDGLSNITIGKYRHDLLDQIHALTPWMEGYPLKLRRWAAETGLSKESFPQCPICHASVGFNRGSDELALTCNNPSCKLERGSMSQDAWDHLSNKEWLYEERIVKRRSYKDIGKQFGLSGVPVVKKCKQFGIHGDKYNTVTDDKKSLLEDKEFLVSKYVIEGKTYQAIADEIGVSDSIVINYLQNVYRIEPKKANSYPRKFVRRSKGHTDLGDWLEKSGIRVQWDNRGILDGFEIDLYLPDYKIGIEYNGLYYHRYVPDEECDALRKDHRYHLNKTIKAQENDVFLIQIFSDEWEQKQDIVKSIIMSKLGKNERIGARQCKIVYPKNEQKKSFLLSNHIQGTDKSNLSIGLEYRGELIALMTFCKSRFDHKFDWELSRFCTKQYMNVIGAFSKLLKKFKTNHPNEKIISYANRRWSNGNVYLKNGFEQLRVNKPQYWYLDKSYDKRYHRSQFMKYKIAESKDDPRTEWEIVKSMGYSIIYDCGTIAYKLD